jgi:undecaprenyl-diphosphatase
MITYLQAALIGLLQGITELFPVSSLGHSVLVPAFIGGTQPHPRRAPFHCRVSGLR